MYDRRCLHASYEEHRDLTDSQLLTLSSDLKPNTLWTANRCYVEFSAQRQSFLFLCTYERISKIFRTGAAIYTAVVVVRSTGRWQDYHVSVPSCTKLGRRGQFSHVFIYCFYDFYSVSPEYILYTHVPCICIVYYLLLVLTNAYIHIYMFVCVFIC
jgi:hypothetical protein